MARITIDSRDTDDDQTSELDRYRDPMGGYSLEKIETDSPLDDAADREDQGDIAAGILRAAGRQVEDFGPPPRDIAGQQNLVQRSYDIERAIEKLPGEENTLGLARTGFSIGKFFVDNIVGVAKTIATGLDTAFDIKDELPEEGRDILGESLLTKKQKLYDKERYVKFYDEQINKFDRNFANAAIRTAHKIFDESPELKNEGEFVKGVIDRLAGQAGTISEREADEITGYWRPEASTTEQVIRAVPEIIGGTVAGIKFFSRGSKKLIKEFEETLGKSVFKANDDEIAETITTMMEKATFKATEAIRVGGLVSIRKKMYGQRVAGIVKMKQAPDRLRKNAADIRAAKTKLKEARTTKDKTLIRQEEAALKIARSERLDALPKQLIEIPITETGAVLGAAIGGNMFGEEYGTLLGALGGGFGSAIGFEATFRLSKGLGQSVGSLIAGLGNSLGALDDTQIRLLAEKGLVTNLGDINKKDRDALTGFATFIRSLPKEEREQVYSQIKFFKEVRQELTEAGVDPKVLDTTMGKATGLIPLMMMKDSISTYKLSLSKGVGKVDKELELLLKNESHINEQLNEFRGLLDKLAGSAENAGVQNDKLNGFIDAMRSVAMQEKMEIASDASLLRQYLLEFIEKANNPAMRDSVEDKEALDGIIELAMRTGLIREGAFPDDPSSLALRGTQLPALREAGEAAAGQAESTAKEQEDDLISFLLGYLSPDQYQNNAEASAERFLDFANIKKIALKAGASQEFEDLNKLGVQVDVTSWLRGLYGDNAYTDVINHKGTSKLLKRLGERRIAKAGLLESYANMQGKINGQEALDSNPQLKQALRETMLEEGYFDDLTEGQRGLFEQGAEGFDITFSDVRNFFQKEYRRSADEQITDFDAFIIMREVAEVENLGELSIKIGIEDIQHLSSGFSASSARAYRANKLGIAEKDAELSKSIVDTIEGVEGVGPEIADRLRAAKENWVNNVIRRFRDKDGNPIGYEVNQPRTGKKAVKLVDMDKLINGTTQDGADVIESLAKTFGRYDEETGEYILDGEAQTIVRNLMNDLLARHISETDSVRTALNLGGPDTTKLPLLQDTRRTIKGAEGVSEQAAERKATKAVEGRKVRLKKALESSKIIDSPALDALVGYKTPDGTKLPLIDPVRVSDYNNHVDVALGGTRVLEAAEQKVKQDVALKARQALALVDLRQKFLDETMKFMPFQEGGKSVNNYQSFLDFYVENPRGLDRFRQSIPKLAEEMNVSENEIKELFADLTVESLSRATYGDMREYRVGNYLADFDYQGFINFVKGDTGDTIREIVGPERFRSVTRMADMLNIQNRDLTARLRESGINVTTPKGLSIESLLSRAYSVSRGVISPKYVATEVALLSFRKKKAESLSRILSDPKMVDAVIDIVETGGGDVIKRYNANIATVLLNGLAYHEAGKRREKTREQIKQLELDKFRR